MAASVHLESDGSARRRRRVRLAQRYVMNPPMKAATWMGWSTGHVLVETRGRRSGRRRRTIVGMRLDGDTGWVVAEQGRHAGYVRNLSVDPHVRVRIARRWRAAVATMVAGDDPSARLDSFGRASHAAAVRRFGADLLTVRFDFGTVGAAPADPADPAGPVDARR
jgi:deazaflavin-dependent oxidoreductase (nitroreductase family)